ncbi:Hypothetical protein DHA2_11054 [Giardia duodenalis]|uniref:RING-type domain-containing protein n=1 Tax=Giardia intestinalis TaxID=5741 RepID=V6TGK1_GIAIN|nr:Hypothetical protein DHA2_11054 [Giardia intestinalis]
MSSFSSESSSRSSLGDESHSSSDSESSETPQRIDLGKTKLLNLRYRNYVLKDATNAELMEEPPSPKNVDEQKIFDHITQSAEPARKRILMLSNMLAAESIPYGFVDSFQLSMRRSFLCPLCKTILLHPYTFTRCGHSLCLPCLKLHEVRSGRLSLSFDVFSHTSPVLESICIHDKCSHFGPQSIFPNLALESSIMVFLANNPSDVQGADPEESQSQQMSELTCTKSESTLSYSLDIYSHITTGLQKNSIKIDPGVITFPDLLTFLDNAIHQKDEAYICVVCKRRKEEFTFPNNSADVRLIRYLPEWSPKEVKTIVGDLTALYGNQVECEIYKQIKGETYIEDGWEELLGTLQAQYSASFYPYVGADSFVSEGMLCCYRCLKIIVEAMCTFYRSTATIGLTNSNIKPRKRCLCGTGCRLQYISETHMQDYEHSGIGCRGDQSMTIFGSNE